MDKPRTIFHVDMDAFFASIEVKDNPSLAGKPVIVCGDPTGRSVVTSPTYEARPYGIRAGMAVAEARRRCPRAIFVEGNHKKYTEHSLLLQKALLSFTPDMEPWSIDEAFLDMSFAADTPAKAEALGRRIKDAIHATVGTRATIGVGPNKLVAKLASKHQKPDGLTVIPADEAAAFVAALPIGKLWGVGEKFEASLQEMGIRTVADVLPFSLDLLREVYGAAGEALYLKARAIDDTPVVSYYIHQDPKSVGHEITFDRNIGDPGYIASVLASLADRVAVRLREQGLRARTVTVKIRFPNFVTRSKRATLYEPSDYDHELFLAAVSAWNQFAREGVQFEKSATPARHRPGQSHYVSRDQRVHLSREPLRRGIRLLGISASDLHEAGCGEQTTIFENYRVRENRISSALDSIREKYGRDSITRARAAPGMKAGEDEKKDRRQ